MSPLLTVAIPTYNRANYLSKTLDSILLQAHSQVEIVISNNGSDDETEDVLKQYSDLYTNIRVCGFSQNLGIDQNIVNVIKNSKGEYVHLCSDDDLVERGVISNILDEIHNTNPTVICMNHYCFKESGKELPSFLPPKRVLFSEGQEFFKYCGLGFLSSLVFKRIIALNYITKIRNKKECAHLDILSRVVLQDPGVFVYLGTTRIAGRSLTSPRYKMINSCVIYQKQLFDELFHEKLIDLSTYHFFGRRLLRDSVRILFKLEDKSERKNAIAQLEGSFVEFPRLMLCIKVLFNQNHHLLTILKKLAKTAVDTQRKFKSYVYEKIYL